MGKGSVLFSSFNGGMIGEEVLSRINQEKYPNTSEVLTNWMPMKQGGMSFRSGTRFITELSSPSNLKDFFITLDKKYLLIFDDYKLRILNNDNLVSHQAVSSTIPDFDSWTLENGTLSNGALHLLATSTKAAASSNVTVELGKPHTLEIVVERGDIDVKISDSGKTYYSGGLKTGTHLLQFTPETTLISLEFTATKQITRIISPARFMLDGVLTLDTPWSHDEFTNLRFTRSRDVLFVGSGTGEIKRLERRGDNSWSLTSYQPNNGPWLDPNIDDDFTLTPSLTEGGGTLTSNQDFFYRRSCRGVVQTGAYRPSGF